MMFVGLIGLAIVTGCSEDKLDVINPNQLSPETFLVTPSQVQSAVNSVYSNLQTRGLYARHMFFMMDNMAHENAGNPQLEADKRQYLEFAFDPSHGAIRAYWESCYRGINKANYVLANAEKINSIPNETLSQSQKDIHFAEVKFLRGLYYFFLVTRYGDVPLLTSIPETGEGTPKSSKNEIYDLIVADLTEASTKLLSKSETQLGRATKEAALALLGKVQFFRGDYAAAKGAFEKIIGDFSLIDNFANNFIEETEHNEESIFEIEYQASLGDGDKWNSDASGLGLDEVTFRGQEYGWNDWFNVYPSDDLINEFEDNDPRYAGTFYSNGDLFNNGAATVAIPLDRVAAWRKYQNYYKQANEDQRSGINFRMIRYADVLLMMAEVENELGNGPVAIGYLNQVRDRVGMPNYGTPAMDGIYPVGTKAQIFTAIVHERKVELAGEQVRFPDLVRWGLAADELGQYGFVAGKHEVFPIPQQEITANSALTNADQNNGY